MYAAVVSNDYVLVHCDRRIQIESKKCLEIVKLLDIKTKKWFTAAPLPYGINYFQYIMGGYTTYSKIISFCSLKELVHSNA